MTSTHLLLFFRGGGGATPTRQMAVGAMGWWIPGQYAPKGAWVPGTTSPKGAFVPSGKKGAGGDE